MEEYDHAPPTIAMITIELSLELKAACLKRSNKPKTFPTRKAYWLIADPIGTLHADINESDEPIEVMVIEFKTAQGD